VRSKRDVTIVRLWGIAGVVYPHRGLRNFWRRACYVRQAIRVRHLLAQLSEAPPSSPLGRHVTIRPQVLNFVEAPFINARWDAAQRLSAFLRQFEIAQSMGEVFGFDPDKSVEILTLEWFGPDYLIVMDKPSWFQREGIFTINIFRQNLRLISLCFSFDIENGERIVVIGAVQGRRIDGALDEYRQLTKLANGMRPRDFLIDIVRILGAVMGAQRMIAISDACRQHRSPYFGRDTKRTLALDYDEIWRDRGGVPRSDGFFELSIDRQVRDIDEIPSKKRQMYRQRYAMMDAIEERIRKTLKDLKPTIRPEAD